MRLALLIVCFLAACATRASAGPPYITDDPDPTEYRHWEIYSGLQYENDLGDVSESIPFAEFNYGAMPNLQVSISSELDEEDTKAASRYGYGTTEFGVKGRFVQESASLPQVSFYPSIQIPASGGHIVTFLPLWLQKSWGAWTAFGGGGLYINRGPQLHDYTFVGAAGTRVISTATSIGVELYHQGSQTSGGTDLTAAGVGATSQIGRYHAILVSIGRALHGGRSFNGYASYEFALGPGETRK